MLLSEGVTLEIVGLLIKCFLGGGFSFIVIGESISDTAEYVHECLQALFFFFLNLFFGFLCDTG